MKVKLKSVVLRRYPGGCAPASGLGELFTNLEDSSFLVTVVVVAVAGCRGLAGGTRTARYGCQQRMSTARRAVRVLTYARATATLRQPERHALVTLRRLPSVDLKKEGC